MNRVIHKNKLKYGKKGITENHRNIGNSNTRTKNKKKIKKKRRMKLDIILYLFLVIFSLLFITAAFTLFFKIDNIYVVGYDEYDTQNIINLSGIKRGSNLLLFDKSAAQKIIHKSLPYAEHVEIKKKLPSSIEINIKKAEKSFSVNSQDQFLIISSCGRILEETEDVHENILIIKGMELLSYNIGDYIQYKNLQVENTLNKIKESINSINFLGVTLIDVSNLNEIILNYENRVDIKIGNSDDIAYKILTAKEILESKIGKLEKGTLNVSGIKYDNKSYFTPFYVKN